MTERPTFFDQSKLSALSNRCLSNRKFSAVETFCLVNRSTCLYFLLDAKKSNYENSHYVWLNVERCFICVVLFFHPSGLIL